MTKLQVSAGSSASRVEVQVGCMVVVMVLAFLVTWLPYAAVAFAMLVAPDLHIDPLVASLPVFFAKSSTMYNPIIYIFMNRQVTDRLQVIRNRPPIHQRVCFKVSRLRCSHASVWVEPVGVGTTRVRVGDDGCVHQQENLLQRVSEGEEVSHDQLTRTSGVSGLVMNRGRIIPQQLEVTET